MILTGARWSSAARCPLMGAHTALGTEGTEPSEEAREYFARGHLFERYVVDQLRAKYGHTNVVPQHQVTWGNHWTGHADALVSPPDGEPLLVEVFSSTSPSGITLEAKMTQLRGYVAFSQRAGLKLSDTGILYLIDPSRLRRADALPIVVRDEDRAEVEAIEAAIVRAVETHGAELPACTACTPSECYWKGCPYTAVAWADWQPSAPDTVTEGKVAKLVEARLAAKEAEDRFRTQYDIAEQVRRELDHSITALLEPGTYSIRGHKVTYSAVKGRETFSMATARKAGAWTPLDDERLGGFVKVGEPHTRLAIKAADPEPEFVPVTAQDYGDLPF